MAREGPRDIYEQQMWNLTPTGTFVEPKLYASQLLDFVKALEEMLSRWGRYPLRSSAARRKHIGWPAMDNNTHHLQETNGTRLRQGSTITNALINENISKSDGKQECKWVVIIWLYQKFAQHLGTLVLNKWRRNKNKKDV